MHVELVQIERTLHKAVESIATNPKYFFRYAKKKSKIKTKIGPLEDPVSGQLIGDNVKMANILAEQYNKMFSVPSTSNEILRE